MQLRRVGTRLLGLCPFHQERTPSFSVTPERGLFYCFGCHAGGDVFDFVMRRDGVTFAEALQELARRAGVPLEARLSPEERRREELLALLAEAARFYEEALWGPGGEKARRYLEGRRLPPEVVRTFRLGYAPTEGVPLAERLRRKGYATELMAAAGVVRLKEGRAVELLRGRLIFPIRDRAGRVVGFGGRILAAEGPKYLNTPETALFRKRALLYDAYLAREAARQRQRVVLVEGYMDVLALHAVGVTEAVASMGTALGEGQVRQLAQLAPTVVIAYDADSAGQEATERSLWSLAREGMEVRVAVLPPGLDPDDLRLQDGPEELRRRLEAGVPLTRYLVERRLEGAELTPRKAAEIAREVLPGILLLKGAVEQEGELRRVAGLLGVSEEALRRELRRLTRRIGREARLEVAPARNTPRERPLRESIEIDIITVLARDPSLTPQVTATFVGEDTSAILEALRRGVDPASLEDPALRALWAEVCSRASDEGASLGLLLAHHRREGQKIRLNELRKEITRHERSGQPVPQELLDEMMHLLRETKRPLEGGATP